MVRRPRVVATVVALAVVAVSASAAGAASRPTFMTPFDPQGGFEVQALVGGFWQTVGDVPCDRYVRERAVALPAAALAEPRVRVRLVQHGGGAAQIDRVVLGETPPARVAGAAEPDAAALAARRDNDVLDAFGRTIELTFAGGSRETTLRLAARVEPRVNEGGPLAYPPENLLEPVTPASAFYTYRPAPDGRAPAWPGALDPARALFAERCRPTTGHPDGITYGWVANDRDTLYAEVDFTSDNTRDGNKDWASVSVLRGGVVREFRVSEDRTRWGRPSFVTTERAAYHHKLYAFAIPFSELGARDARDAGDLKLAFNAYGTTAAGWLVPLFHDFGAVQPGTTSAPLIVTITNVYQGNITLATPYVTRLGPNSSAFPLTAVTCVDGAVLTAGASCTFHVSFAPPADGSYSDGIVVHILDPAGAPQTQTLSVVGEGVTSIPSASALGLALLALALSGLGWFVLRRR